MADFLMCRLSLVPLAVSCSAALPWLSSMLVTPTSSPVASKREESVHDKVSRQC